MSVQPAGQVASPGGNAPRNPHGRLAVRLSLPWSVFGLSWFIQLFLPPDYPKWLTIAVVLHDIAIVSLALALEALTITALTRGDRSKSLLLPLLLTAPAVLLAAPVLVPLFVFVGPFGLAWAASRRSAIASCLWIVAGIAGMVFVYTFGQWLGPCFVILGEVEDPERCQALERPLSAAFVAWVTSWVGAAVSWTVAVIRYRRARPSNGYSSIGSGVSGS